MSSSHGSYKSVDGINLKVVRAEQHLNALKDEMGKYYRAADANPSVVRIEDMGELWSFTLGEVLEPPMILSAIVGDCATNLRAPLDYIARALHESVAGPLGIDAISPTFPIYTDETNFQRNTRLADLHIPATALAEVKAVQPFASNAGYEPLAFLHALTNRDKHRLPLLTMIFGGHAFARLMIGGQGGEAVTSLSFAKWSFPEGWTPSRMDMDIELAGIIAFCDPGMPREPIDVTLQNILVTVRDRVVPRFLPFIT